MWKLTQRNPSHSLIGWTAEWPSLAANQNSSYISLIYCNLSNYHLIKFWPYALSLFNFVYYCTFFFDVELIEASNSLDSGSDNIKISCFDCDIEMAQHSLKKASQESQVLLETGFFFFNFTHEFWKSNFVFLNLWRMALLFDYIFLNSNDILWVWVNSSYCKVFMAACDEFIGKKNRNKSESVAPPLLYKQWSLGINDKTDSELGTEYVALSWLF